MKKILVISTFIVCFLFSQPVFAEEYVGKVVGVSDGDTFTLLIRDNKTLKIRMAEIDAPEKDQPFGAQSKKILSDLIFGKNIKVIKNDTDKYGRTIGRAYVGASDINLELVKVGAAWAYRQYLTDNNFITVEDEAKLKKLGLWALQADQIMPPWEWRNGGGKKTTAASPTAPVPLISKSIGSFQCSGKVYCKQMINCAEARFYLLECGLSRLDGDRDGVPCESLCR